VHASDVYNRSTMYYSILKTQSDLRIGHEQQHSYQTDVPPLDGSIVPVSALQAMLKFSMSKFKEAKIYVISLILSKCIHADVRSTHATKQSINLKNVCR